MDRNGWLVVYDLSIIFVHIFSLALYFESESATQKHHLLRISHSKLTIMQTSKIVVVACCFCTNIAFITHKCSLDIRTKAMHTLFVHILHDYVKLAAQFVVVLFFEVRPRCSIISLLLSILHQIV